MIVRIYHLCTNDYFLNNDWLCVQAPHAPSPIIDIDISFDTEALSSAIEFSVHPQLQPIFMLSLCSFNPL